jgi:hypothetical protein
MRLFGVAALMLLVAGVSSAQEWFEYVNRDDLFVINFPGQPDIQETTYKSEFGLDLPARVYTAQSGPSRYKITVVDYKDAEVGDLRGSVAWASWEIRKRGGDITHDGFNQNDRIEGHQLHVVYPDNTRLLTAIHQHARRLYIVEGTAPVDYPPPAEFQQTLVIIDSQGTRVRYDLDENGNRTNRVEYGPDDNYAGPGPG